MEVLLKSSRLNGHTLNRLQEVSLACLKVRAILDVTIYKIVTSVDSFHCNAHTLKTSYKRAVSRL